ncbi:MAG: hypothetical protein IPG04_18165 [Polyangiaceae bacterium]|nr:hypothetical protein [Polyangiaceae bacterium]
MARGQIRVDKRTTPMELTRLFSEALEASADDVAALHEALFGLEEVEDLEVGVEELEADLEALKAEAAEARGTVALPSGATCAAPPRWFPAVDACTPLHESAHPSGEWIARTLPGDRPRAAIWTAAGALASAPEGAIQVVFTPDGSEVFVLFDHWLERRAWPSMELGRRFSLGRIDGYADRLSLSPKLRYAAVSHTSWRGPHGAVALFDLADGKALDGTNSHSHAAGPVVFGEEETVYAYANLDRRWPELAEEERAKDKPWKVDFGSLSIGKIGGLGAGSWALYGAIPEPGSPTDGAEGVPVFVEGRQVELRLPTGEVERVDYATLFRTFAPNPKEFPEVVRHRVRPRARNAAELAVEGSGWAPAEPFSAAWTQPETEVLVATKHQATRRAFPSGEILGKGALCVFDGWPTEVTVREDGEVAAVVWHRPAEFACGVEALDLRGADPRQLFGRGRRCVHWMKRMQPLLIGPLVFGPNDQLAFTATFGGFWYDPSIDGVGQRPMSGFAHVHPLYQGTVKRLHLHGEKNLPPDHDQSDDPDRARSLRFTGATSLEIELPHGERIEKKWGLEDPQSPHDVPYPNTIAALEPVAIGGRRVPVRVAGRGALGSFAVPVASTAVLARSAEVHPSGGYVILNLAEPAEGGSLAGVFSAVTGELVFSHEGALAMAWAVGRPHMQSQTSRDLVILTRDELISWTLPTKERGVHQLSGTHVPRTLDVCPRGRYAIVTFVDPNASQLTVLVADLANGHEPCEQELEPLTEGLACSAFSPDGGTWAAFVPALEPVKLDSGLTSGGTLLLYRVGGAELMSRALELSASDVAQLRPGADAVMAWVGEDDLVVELPGLAPRSFDRTAEA